MLGLSEGGLPSVIDPQTFDYEGQTDFGGGVPQFLTFTAHPRIDPKTGDMFAYGFEKRPPGSAHIYQIERASGTAKLLYKIPMDGFYMVHDSILTENYFILLIPPVQYDVRSMMSGKTMSDATKFLETMPIRLLAFPRDNKDGMAKPIEINLPAQFFFHFGNAFETADGKLVFDVISGDNAQILETLRTWKKDPYKSGLDSLKTWETLRRVTVDLKNKVLVSSEDFAENIEFPRYDSRLTGKSARYLYTTENGYGANAAITRIDFQKNSLKKAAAGKTRTFGEPVFVPQNSNVSEDRGWLLTQGYDSDRNESFLEIRDAQTLEFASRIWQTDNIFRLDFTAIFTPDDI
jgi:carotenoid cleavage dioxygenase-like enzyme